MATQSLVHRGLQLLQLGLFLGVFEVAVRPSWPTLVAFFGGDRGAYVWGVVALHALTLLAGNLFFWALYRGAFPSIERYKSSREPWPWAAAAAARGETAAGEEAPAVKKGREGGDERAAAFRALCVQGALLTLFNTALSVPMAWANYHTAVLLGFSARAEDFPSPYRIAASIALFSVVEDALFYWAHRALHTFPLLYRHVHKVHHAFVSTVSIAAEATHPLEFVVSNVIPFAAGPLLSGAHCATLWAWTVWRVGETVANHSGYALPWSVYELLPFQGTAEAHDAHHRRFSGNYGSLFVFWDSLCGTALPALSLPPHTATGGGGVDDGTGRRAEGGGKGEKRDPRARRKEARRRG